MSFTRSVRAAQHTLLRRPSSPIRLLSSSPSHDNSRILIIGGGISGLALGQSLHQARIPFTIFERDPSPTFRPQGYRISHTDDAERDLRDMVGEKMFEKIRAMGTGQEDRGLPGTVLFAGAETGGDLDLKAMFGGGGKGAKGGKGGPSKGAQGDDKQKPDASSNKPNKEPYGKKKPEFKSDRTVLRGILSSNITSAISYNKRFLDFSTSNFDGLNTVTAHFEDGSTESGALIIGSDGVRSKVHSAVRRHQGLARPTLLDLGRRGIYGKTLLTPEFEAMCPERWRSTTALIRDPRNPDAWMFREPVIFNNRVEDYTDGKVKTPKNYLYWAYIAKAEDYGMSDLELFNLDEKQVAALSLRMTTNWNASIRLALQHQLLSETSMLAIQSAHPEIPTRPSHPSVTLMGDAIHAMAPTGGNGANTAIRDAAILSSLLRNSWNEENGWAEGTIAELVKEYEGEMMDNGRKVLRAAFGTIFAKLMMGGKEPDGYTKFEV